MAKRINEKGRTLSCLFPLSDAGYFLACSAFLVSDVFAFAADGLAGFTQPVMNFLRSSPFSFFSFAWAEHSLLRAFCASDICFLGDSVIDFSAFGLSPFLSCAMAVMLAAANTAATIKDSSLLISFS